MFLASLVFTLSVTHYIINCLTKTGWQSDACHAGHVRHKIHVSYEGHASHGSQVMITNMQMYNLQSR